MVQIYQVLGSKVEDHQKVEALLENYGSYSPKRYNYAYIKRITNRFRSKLGHGGFGNVYKGSLTNRSQVAVKVLNELKGRDEDFINEVASSPLKGLIPTSPLKGLIPTSPLKGLKCFGLLGDFLADAKLGRYLTIAIFASIIDVKKKKSSVDGSFLDNELDKKVPIAFQP
ncbi:hypothetical protein BC332_24377 [Capsicum chinense]|nr:hypothetical protein BC332_24377 [Capsicum chinense]